MPDKNKKDKNKKGPDKGGSKSTVPAKTNTPKHEDAPERVTEHREVGIGMPTSHEDMEALKEKARKLDR